MNENIYHSVKFVDIAAIKPKKLKLISNELHNARPNMIGNNERFVQNPVISPILKQDLKNEK